MEFIQWCVNVDDPLTGLLCVQYATGSYPLIATPLPSLLIGSALDAAKSGIAAAIPNARIKCLVVCIRPYFPRRAWDIPRPESRIEAEIRAAAPENHGLHSERRRALSWSPWKM